MVTEKENRKREQTLEGYKKIKGKVKINHFFLRGTNSKEKLSEIQ